MSTLKFKIGCGRKGTDTGLIFGEDDTVSEGDKGRLLAVICNFSTVADASVDLESLNLRPVVPVKANQHIGCLGGHPVAHADVEIRPFSLVGEVPLTSY